jgi:DNA-directed RNA polymerase sigma subunit (sigma70/sigma32)
VSTENTLARQVIQPDDIYYLVPWNRLSNKSLWVLRRTMIRATIDIDPYINGFNFDLLSRITLDDLRDARNVGEKKAQELINELNKIFSMPLVIPNSTMETFLDGSSILDHALNTSLNILAYISVEESLSAYQARIAKNSAVPESDIRQMLVDYRKNKSPNWFFLNKQADPDLILMEIVRSQLRFIFVLARVLYPGIDLRTKILAGNLALVGAIKTFDLASPIPFSTYLESTVEEFIENLVFLSNMEYKTIEKMLIEGHLESEFNTNEVESLTLTISSDANMMEILEFIELKFSENPKIDERIASILKERLLLFTNAPKTLEAIAREWNLTRERIRQISNKWAGIKLEQFLEIQCLKDAVDCLSTSKDEDEFNNKITEIPTIGDIPISAYRLKAICEFFTASELVERIDKKIYEWENADRVQNEFQQELKKLRSQIGLYDLTFLLSRFKVTRAELELTINEIYPRTLIKGNLALARTKNWDTMFENSVAKQLFVASNLGVDELIIGLERTSINRGLPLIGTKDDLRELVIYLAGENPTYGFIAAKMMKPVTLQSIDSWLVKVFRESDSLILHSNELVTKALNERINVSSLQVYLGNSPIIRSHGRSIYSLVGSKVESETVEIYRKVVLASGKASQIKFNVSAGGIELSIRPNLNVITSGIIFPPSGLKNMIIGYTFDSACVCGNLLSEQQVKFSSSGFWTGFTAMIRHGMSKHNMTKESEFIFVFDFENLVVALHFNQGYEGHLS